MAAAQQSYSSKSQNRQWRIEIPEHNYREDGLKSQCFQYGYYVPSERRWVGYQRHRSLPPCTHRDAIDIQYENQYVQLKRKLNKYRGDSLLGTLPGQVPYVKWNGHKRIPQDPCIVHHFAKCYISNQAYPCDYLEALDSFNRRECRPPVPSCCDAINICCTDELHGPEEDTDLCSPIYLQRSPSLPRC